MIKVPMGFTAGSCGPAGTAQEGTARLGLQQDETSLLCPARGARQYTTVGQKETLKFNRVKNAKNLEKLP